MKNKNIEKIFKKLLVVAIAVYVIYTFFAQQKSLNAYKADEVRYEKQIAEEEDKKEKLNQTKNNINSEEYIEEIARERLDMYLPNEKVYIDISK